MMETVQLRNLDVPVWLQESAFFESLERNGVFSVPANCFAMEPEVNSIDDLDRVLETIQFWCVYSIPTSVAIFILEKKGEAVQIKSIGEKYHQTLMWVSQLNMLAGRLPCERMRVALGCGSIAIVQVLVKLGYRIYSQHFCQIVRNEDMELFEFCLNHACIARSQCSKLLNEARNPRQMGLFLAKFGPVWDSSTVCAIVLHRDVSLVKFCHENGCPRSTEALPYAIGRDKLEVAEYLIDKGVYDRNALIETDISRFCSLSMLQLIHNIGVPLPEKVFQCTLHPNATDGVALIIYLRVKGVPWGADWCAWSAKQGRLDVLQYLHEQGCPWTADTATEAAKLSLYTCCRGPARFEILKYALEHGCPVQENLAGEFLRHVAQWCNYACSRDQTSILQDVLTLLRQMTLDRGLILQESDVAVAVQCRAELLIKFCFAECKIALDDALISDIVRLGSVEFVKSLLQDESICKTFCAEQVPIHLMTPLPPALQIYARIANTKQMLQCLYEELHIAVSSQCLCAALKLGDVACVEYLVSVNCPWPFQEYPAPREAMHAGSSSNLSTDFGLTDGDSILGKRKESPDAVAEVENRVVAVAVEKEPITTLHEMILTAIRNSQRDLLVFILDHYDGVVLTCEMLMEAVKRWDSVRLCQILLDRNCPSDVSVLRTSVSKQNPSARLVRLLLQRGAEWDLAIVHAGSSWFTWEIFELLLNAGLLLDETILVICNDTVFPWLYSHAACTTSLRQSETLAILLGSQGSVCQIEHILIHENEAYPHFDLIRYHAAGCGKVSVLRQLIHKPFGDAHFSQCVCTATVHGQTECLKFLYTLLKGGLLCGIEDVYDQYLPHEYQRASLTGHIHPGYVQYYAYRADASYMYYAIGEDSVKSATWDELHFPSQLLAEVEEIFSRAPNNDEEGVEEELEDGEVIEDEQISVDGEAEEGVAADDPGVQLVQFLLSELKPPEYVMRELLPVAAAASLEPKVLARMTQLCNGSDSLATQQAATNAEQYIEETGATSE